MRQPTFSAVIGDAVASRALSPKARGAVQQALTAALTAANRRWRRHIASPFAIVLGDQFEGLLTHDAPTWDVIQYLRAALAGAEWVMAVGRGTLSTPLGKRVAELDGPCFHAARQALEDAKREGRVLACGGFANGVDALARYHSALYANWTPRQRELARLLRIMPAADAAERLGVDRSAVSHLARRMHWKLVAPADSAFKALMEDA